MEMPQIYILLIELAVYAFVATFVAIVVLGHVLLAAVADFMRKTLEITVAVIVRFRRPHRHCAMQLSPGQ
jgi:hypothetical protein